MPKIKEVYEYNNGSWENGTPIGADASNVDVALSDSTSTRDLQSVLGNVSVSDSSIKTQLSGKVDTDSGDIKDTVVSVLDPSSATDTSEDIDSTDVIVAAGEDQTTMWSKFNIFRKRVSNKFSNFLINSVEDVLEPSDTKTYSQAALNSYFADVIGYKTDADVASIGSVADQLSTLNNNLGNSITQYYESEWNIIKYKSNAATTRYIMYTSVVHSVGSWTPWGGNYYSSVTFSRNFPMTFSGIPYIWASISGTTASSDGWPCVDSPVTTSNTGNWVVLRGNNQTSAVNIEMLFLVLGYITN